MDFNQGYILENVKVQLRPLANTDFDALLQFSRNEPEILRYSLLLVIGIIFVWFFLSQFCTKRWFLREINRREN